MVAVLKRERPFMKLKKTTLLLFATGFIGIIILLFIFTNFQRNLKINSEINLAVEALTTMENRDVFSMESDIDSMKKRSLAPDDYPNHFDTSVVLGDSISEGLVLFNFLKPSSVVGTLGKSAKSAIEDVPKLVSLAPQNVFIELGLNDLSHPDRDLNTFIKDYEQLIDSIKFSLPKTRIYICSIFPVTDELIGERPEFAQIPEYNAALIEIAKRKNVNYIDTFSFGKQNEALHDDDGIHYYSEFYPLWLDYLIKNSVLSKQL